MMDFLKFIDARLGEASTWTAIATMLLAAHINVDAGVWHQVTLWGMIGSGVAGILLKEVGTKPAMQITQDMLNGFVAAVKALPDQAGKTVAMLAVLVGAGAFLAGCTPTGQLSPQAVATGQLYCATATATGPLVVALADASGVPVTATNKASSVVQAACAVINAVPVSPPANPAQAPVVAAPVAPAASTPAAAKS